MTVAMTMPITMQDQFLIALTVWRENRGGGYAGMQSVANVILNRATTRKTSPYVECIRAWQFSSITAKGDPELILWPALNDATWKSACTIAEQAAAGTLPDITEGATSYYALTITAPNWAAAMIKTVTIENQVFFK